MRFLWNLFRTTPAPYELPTIASRISSGFQIVKQQWFNECAVAVDLGLFADKLIAVDPGCDPNKQTPERVVHSDLGGAAALAITGYQICCVSRLLAENRYISKSSSKDFIDLLCGRVSGVQTSELLEYMSRYDTANNDAPTQRFMFGVDVARYITNEEPSMILSLHVASLAEKLFTLTSMVVAKAFGDSAGAHKLSREIRLMDKQLWQN